MTDRHVGLISGTSMDGIDAVVVDFDADPARIEAALTRPFEPPLQQLLDQVRSNPDLFPTARLAELDTRLGDAFADAALQVIAKAGRRTGDIRSIGSHGQTVAHHPEADPPWTLQVGDPHRITAITGITTVADFRRADLAAGGQGAPLAPLLHRALLASAQENRAVVNLGGIANLTWLPKSGGVSGFDTGPANCFLDLWYRRHHEGRFDRNGDWAAGGEVDTACLDRLLEDPYFTLSPPKSTGIEYFSPAWLDRHLPDWANGRPRDFQATLAEFSARSLADAAPTSPSRMIVCGGGVRNQDLLHRLSRHLADTPVQSSADFGIDPDFVEAMLFAWLARQRLDESQTDTTAITGALHPHLCGVIVYPGTSEVNRAKTFR